MQAHPAQPVQAATAVAATAAAPAQPAQHSDPAAAAVPQLHRHPSQPRLSSPPADSPLRVQPRVVDPYEPQVEFPLPLFGQALLFLLDLVLVPLRILCALLLLILLWASCKLLTIGVRPARAAGEPGFGPLRTWLIRWAVRSFATPFCYCFGLVTARVRHSDADTTRGVLISNHFGYVEIMILIASYAPSVVAKAEVESYPLIGTVARALQCVFVDRKDPESRARARDLMIERARARDGLFPPLLLFPEGTTNSGAAMLRMQKGIFAAGRPVQPLAVRAHFCFFNSTWVRGNMGTHVLRLLTRLYHSLSLQELPLYTPSQAEQDDPVLFADNVATTIANALGQVVTNKTMYDNPELAPTVKKRRQMRQEEKEKQAAEAAAAGAVAGGQTSQTRPAAQGEGGDLSDPLSPTSPHPGRRSALPEVRIDMKVLAAGHRADSYQHHGGGGGGSGNTPRLHPHSSHAHKTNVAALEDSPSARKHARAWGSGTQQPYQPPKHQLVPRSSNSRTHAPVIVHVHDRAFDQPHSAEIHPFPASDPADSHSAHSLPPSSYAQPNQQPAMLASA